MGFLLAVLSFIVAEEVVELEPVKEEVVKLEPVGVSSTNEYKCKAVTIENACKADPYCYWLAGAAAGHQCIDDPCLKYRALASDSCPLNVLVDSLETVPCTAITLSNFENHDCSGNPGSGALCVQNVYTSHFTYCEYTQLKDGSCPNSICMEKRGTTEVKKHCVKNDPWGSSSAPCEFLAESDCKLVPKCLWKSGICSPDYCFQAKIPTVICEGVTGNPAWGSTTFLAGTCVDWHPLSHTSGDVLDYCIHKDNAKANICYFGNKNVTSSGTPPTDYRYDYSDNWESNTDPGTYPTYNYGTGGTEANPVCGTDGLPNCEGHGQCKTIVNQKGAFAGKYCTDGTHAAANILRIPSLLVFLVVFLGSLFSL